MAHAGRSSAARRRLKTLANMLAMGRGWAAFGDALENLALIQLLIGLGGALSYILAGGARY
jgi:hypothetical protein